MSRIEKFALRRKGLKLIHLAHVNIKRVTGKTLILNNFLILLYREVTLYITSELRTTSTQRTVLFQCVDVPYTVYMTELTCPATAEK